MNRRRVINRKISVSKNKKVQTNERLRKKLALRTGPKKICLTMIVKNESRNMRRVLDSVKEIIDMVSVVDTGSTDKTIKIIHEWGKENNIPTTVHNETFKNFSYNRTHSIRAAKAAYPEADYFLLSDADFVWEVNKNGKFDKVLLIDQKYLIEQYNKSLSYWNIRLLSSKVDWECVGVTHEYWAETKNQSAYFGEIRTTKIKTLMIDDREDGGCKEDKFIRDERLLLEGLNDPLAPNHLKTRYKFYLAQTLKDMCRYEESIDWYNKRILDKGWAEEVFYAKFQIGYNYEQLLHHTKKTIELIGKADKSQEQLNFIKKWNPKELTLSELKEKLDNFTTNAAVHYLAAHTYRKTRNESLYYLTRMYRTLGINDMAYKIAMMGKDIPYPEQDTLFIERACYSGYLFDYEISIVAFYIEGKKEEGREAVSRLMLQDNLPKWIQDNIEEISRHYV